MYHVKMLFIDDYEEYLHVAYCNNFKEIARTIGCTKKQAYDIYNGNPEPEYDLYRIEKITV